MPTDSLTAAAWKQTLDGLRFTDPSSRRMARMLSEIITQSTDPAVGRILDRHASEILK